MSDENAQPVGPTATITRTDVPGPSQIEKPSQDSFREATTASAPPSATAGASVIPASAEATVAQAPEKWGPCLCEAGSGDCHSTVKVESRTWPGINKPGGVGRVMKRTMVEEQRCGESMMMAYYDVKYILGGSEKKILETYIQCVGSDGKSARQACPRDLFTVAAPEPPRRAAVKARPLATSRPNRMGDGETTSILMETKSSMKLMKSGAPPKREAEHPACSIAIKDRKTFPLSSSRLANSGEIGDSYVRKRTWDAEKTSKLMKVKPLLKMIKSGATIKRQAKPKFVQEEKDVRPRAKVPRVSGCVKSKPSEVIPPPPVIPLCITDLSEPVETKEATAPLSHTRMAMLSGLVRDVFSKKSTDKLTVKMLKEEINRLVPADAGSFNDSEMDSAFQFLENEENKLMVSEGQVYLI